MMKVDLYHAAFEDKPEYVATWKFDPKKYDHKSDQLQIVYLDPVYTKPNEKWLGS